MPLVGGQNFLRGEAPADPTAGAGAAANVNVKNFHRILTTVLMAQDEISKNSKYHL